MGPELALAALKVKEAVAEPPAQLPKEVADEDINAGNCRNAYMRFLRKFASKKVKNNSPNLVAAFNDRTQRAQLFVDFYKNGECVTTCDLMHSRRQIQKKAAEQVFRPRSRKYIIETLAEGDEEHAKKHHERSCCQGPCAEISTRSERFR